MKPLMDSASFVHNLVLASFDLACEASHSLIHYWDYDLLHRALFGYQDGLFDELTVGNRPHPLLWVDETNLLLSALVRLGDTGIPLPTIRMTPPHVLEFVNWLRDQHSAQLAPDNRRDAVLQYFGVVESQTQLDTLAARAMAAPHDSSVLNDFVKALVERGRGVFTGTTLTMFDTLTVADRVLTQLRVTDPTLYTDRFRADDLVGSRVFQSAYAAMRIAQGDRGPAGERTRAIARDALAVAHIASCVQHPSEDSNGRDVLVRFHTETSYVETAWTSSGTLQGAVRYAVDPRDDRWPDAAYDCRRTAGYYLLRLVVADLAFPTGEGSGASEEADMAPPDCQQGMGDITASARALYAAMTDIAGDNDGQTDQRLTDILSEYRFADGTTYASVLEWFYDLEFVNRIRWPETENNRLAPTMTLAMLGERRDEIAARISQWVGDASLRLSEIGRITAVVEEVERVLKRVPSRAWFLEDVALMDAVGLDRWTPAQRARELVEKELANVRSDAARYRQGQAAYAENVPRRLDPHIVARVSSGLLSNPIDAESAWRGIAYASLALTLGLRRAPHETSKRIRESEIAIGALHDSPEEDRAIAAVAGRLWAITNVRRTPPRNAHAQKWIASRLAESLDLLQSIRDGDTEGDESGAETVLAGAYVRLQAWRTIWHGLELQPSEHVDHGNAWRWLDEAVTELETMLFSDSDEVPNESRLWLLNYWIYIGSIADRDRVIRPGPMEDGASNVSLDNGVAMLIGMRGQAGYRWSYRFDDTIAYYFFLKAYRRVMSRQGRAQHISARTLKQASREVNEAWLWIKRARRSLLDIEVEDHYEQIRILANVIRDRRSSTPSGAG